MSALEKPLMALLEAIEQDRAPAEDALKRIVALAENSAGRLSPKELRYYEIALGGLGKTAPEIDFLLRQAIQTKREWLTKRREARCGGTDEAA